MPISRISYAFLLTFLAAVLMLQWWQYPMYPSELWQILGFLGLTGFLSCTWHTARKAAPLMIAIVFALACALFCVGRTTHVPSLTTLDWHANETTVTIEGIVADDPEPRGTSRRYVINAKTIRTASGTFAVTGKVLATAPSWPIFEYGDQVSVRGTLEKPGQIEDFRYDNYLSRYGVYAVMFRANLQRSGENAGSALFRNLYAFKHAVEARITSLYPEPEASLLIGLITGSRASMPEKLAADFQVTGLTHIVAISGYNVTMVITILSLVLFWLPLKWRFLPSLGFIALFTLFTGASASVVRAAVMGCLGLLALQLGRTQTTRLTILWAAFFMIAWNPKQLWYDAGLHLSFLALLGVTEVSPLVEPLLRRLPDKFGLRESLQLTLAAQLSTLPWTIHLFRRVSLIAPLSNLLVPPVIPYAMLSGALSIILSTVSQTLGKLIALPAYLVLQWMTRSTTIMAATPLASVETGKAGIILVILSYIVLAACVYLHGRKSITIRISESSSPR